MLCMPFVRFCMHERVCMCVFVIGHAHPVNPKPQTLSMCFSTSFLAPPSFFFLALSLIGEGKLAQNAAGGVGMSSRSLEQSPYVPGQVCE